MVKCLLGKDLLRQSPALVAHKTALLLAKVIKSGDRFGKLLVVAGVDQQPAHSVYDQAFIISRPGCDHWQAASHRLAEHVRTTFIKRWLAENVCVPIQFMHVSLRAVQAKAFLQAVLFNEELEPLQIFFTMRVTLIENKDMFTVPINLKIKLWIILGKVNECLAEAKRIFL
jgi:hypothetical protein